MRFSKLFRSATGESPFPFQRALAEASHLPGALRAPTGAGKTAAAILGWLWRRQFAPKGIRRSTPRRLVYCLPMRVLVEQTEKCAREWLRNLRLGDRVPVHVLMGGEDDGDWDLHPETDAVIIGTQDMLLSRVLNRGYGMNRYRWPMHFGLLNNDCLWVFDEIQLMGSGLATTAQLEAFRADFGTFGTCRSLWMSATLRKDWLGTVDFRDRLGALSTRGLSGDDRKGKLLSKRLKAKKVLKKAGPSVTDTEKIATLVRKKHQPGSLTLVILNRVDKARDLYAKIKKQFQKRKGKAVAEEDGAGPDVLLIHSRFRPGERREKTERLRSKPPGPGRIVVSTQVVEAGVDVSAKTLFTEVAPWPSLVQRFGRCNRYGEHNETEVVWIDVPTKRDEDALPYDKRELDAARAELKKMKDVGPRSLKKHLDGLSDAKQKSLFPYSPAHVVRRKDMLELFDTTPDLAGNDIDVSRFIRDGRELDVQVFWRVVPESGPTADEPAPARDELCSTPFYEFREYLKGDKTAYRWDVLDKRWVRARSAEVFPGQVYLAPADAGGYSPEIGWDGKTAPVEPVVVSGRRSSPEGNDTDTYSSGEWQTIADHTDRVVAELERIVRELGLDGDLRESLLRCARWHDRGKAHEVFQDAVTDGAPRADIWAKAKGTFKRYNRKGFRHELASALAMLEAGAPDLACYLVAAHHGKVRLSIRSLPGERRPGSPEVRFARGAWDGDTLPLTNLGGGEKAPAVELSLAPMELGLGADGSPSWAERMLKLRDAPEVGPFRLAFLEAVLRAADMRASAKHAEKSRRAEGGDA